MKDKGLMAFLAFVLLMFMSMAISGCCENPGVFGKIGQSMSTVQGYYDPLVGQFLKDETNIKLGRAVVAADTALLIAGALQNQWCPDAQAIEQLSIQTQEAKKLAEQAGVK